MEYRRLGRTGVDVSIIGLGMEHLAPEQIAPVVRTAVDRGVTYIDLMIWESGRRDAFGAALAGRRGRVALAGHLGVAETNGQYRKSRDVKECEALWHDWLSRLGTDCIDIVHLSYVDEPEEYEQVVGPGGVLELAYRLKREGKACFLGLSGHNPTIAARAIEDGHLDVVMQCVDIGNAANPGITDLTHLCANQGTGLVVMKTFGGGARFEGEDPISPVKCISYSLSQPGVSTALIGVKNADELETDLAFLAATDEEKDYASVLGALQQDTKGPCVYCNHCLPCPSVIDIASVMRILAGSQYGVTDQLRAAYDALPARASECIECGDCMARCPFEVDITGKMQQAVEIFEPRAT